jgi:hypothetical protein
MVEQLDHLLRISRRLSDSAGGTRRARGARRNRGAVHADGVRRVQAGGLSGQRDACLFLEKPEEIAAYRRILAALADTALGEGEPTQSRSSRRPRIGVAVAIVHLVPPPAGDRVARRAAIAAG